MKLKKNLLDEIEKVGMAAQSKSYAPKAVEEEDSHVKPNPEHEEKGLETIEEEETEHETGEEALTEGEEEEREDNPIAMLEKRIAALEKRLSEK